MFTVVMSMEFRVQFVRELVPFIKWVGGKTNLLGALEPLLPPTYNVYHEPFLGGGAVFLALQPETAFISDMNKELIAAWTSVRDALPTLRSICSTFFCTEKDYYAVRSIDPTTLTTVQKAARFIYLNKTGFQGLYRVNKSGGFNVPFGHYDAPILLHKDVAQISTYLRDAKIDIQCASYEHVLKNVGKGDFVFFDPPYIPVSITANFTAYDRDGFTGIDQEKLAKVFRECSKKGAYCMLTNSDSPLIPELYRGFMINKVSSRRSIAVHQSKTKHSYDTVVRNYE